MENIEKESFFDLEVAASGDAGRSPQGFPRHGHEFVKLRSRFGQPFFDPEL